MIKYPHNANHTRLHIVCGVIYVVKEIVGGENKYIFETPNYLQALAYITDMRRTYGETRRFKIEYQHLKS